MINILLRGGLGNQFFQWQAGKLLQQFTNLDIRFLPQQRRFTHDKFGIDAFDFPDVTILKAHSRKLDLFMKRITRRPDFGLLVTEALSEKSSTFTESSESNFINFCKSQSSQSTSFILDRFFQSSAITQLLEEMMGIIEVPKLKNESAQFRNLIQDLDFGNYTAVHIRRGDYNNFKNSIGLLSEHYYLRAATLLGLTSESKIVFFTDADVNSIIHEFQEFTCKYRNFTFAPKLENAAEVMLSMSHCHKIITANSTLSWWSGKFASHTNVVIPDPFFRSSEISRSLSMPGTLIQESFWA